MGRLCGAGIGRHQVEPDPAEQAERYGAQMTLIARSRLAMIFGGLRREILRPHGQGRFCAERKTFQTVSLFQKGAGPKISHKNHLLCRAGPEFRIRLPPAASLERTGARGCTVLKLDPDV